jgi:AraC-like DNA-binding protein
MPIYMDRHDIPEEITAEHVALMHQEDLKVEHLYGCKGMTYWCDENRKTAFCLIKAPNKEAIQKMHNHAHGEFPHSIIEVNEKIVESFLGRIEDPVTSQNTELNIINDPAFRVIMVVKTSDYLTRLEGKQLTIFTQKFHNSVSKTLKQYEGSIVKKDNNSYLVSFKSVTNAVLSALKIQFNFKYITTKSDFTKRKLIIGMCEGTPVTEKNNLFEEAIILATRMCDVMSDQIIISSDIKSLYESENRHATIDNEIVRVLEHSEKKFLTLLMDYVEKNWNKPNFNVSHFCKELGYSRSQLYRKLKKLSGRSSINFMKEFKLNNALNLLHKQQGNISTIAYESGFNSPAYFTRCFLQRYGVNPSKYVQQHLN